MAEPPRLELGVRLPTHDALAGRCLTIGPRLRMAEVQGFEPRDPCGSAVFKTAALNLSATLPCSLSIVSQTRYPKNVRFLVISDSTHHVKVNEHRVLAPPRIRTGKPLVLSQFHMPFW